MNFWHVYATFVPMRGAKSHLRLLVRADTSNAAVHKAMLHIEGMGRELTQTPVAVALRWNADGICSTQWSSMPDFC